MHIFLDESGDLGFDFKNKTPSKYFVITILVCNDTNSVTTIKNAIKRTIKNKINAKKIAIQELKGTNLTFNIKSYFYKNAALSNSWKIYSIILDKEPTIKKLPYPIDTHRVYNTLANHLLSQVDFSNAGTVNLFVDKSKNRAGIIEFDDMLKIGLGSIIPLNVPFNISHVTSHDSYGIQAVDLFCWGTFKKWSKADKEWYDLFKHKIAYEQEFLA